MPIYYGLGVNVLGPGPALSLLEVGRKVIAARGAIFGVCGLKSHLGTASRMSPNFKEMAKITCPDGKIKDFATLNE